MCKKNEIMSGQKSIFDLAGMENEKSRNEIAEDIKLVKEYADTYEKISQSLLKKSGIISKMLDDICQTSITEEKDKVSYDTWLTGGAAAMASFNLIPADVVEKLTKAADALVLMSRVVSEAARVTREQGEKLHNDAKEMTRIERIRNAWDKHSQEKSGDSIFFTAEEKESLDAEVEAICDEYGFENPDFNKFLEAETEKDYL